ncbi:MAG: hypothetical protein OMM_11902 [Candidatus Magnetoglobus multicellularis str. Araruama]|uniref:Uncharacterized protein n=1 Tax=Candidatus Magnetoglobus multicellularis str. Araruama TaxID=890399 RepID=A0A1V1NX44_9BACT|nr:MAG: hypothetical protein OMM_11902 [Candidatus Magnetoglobus multicellularis str. Araruama]
MKCGDGYKFKHVIPDKIVAKQKIIKVNLIHEQLMDTGCGYRVGPTLTFHHNQCNPGSDNENKLPSPIRWIRPVII